MDQIENVITPLTYAVRGARHTKFTPERLKQIVNLVERGKSREEIAELIGVTVGTLQVTCSRFGISLRRPRFNTGTGYLRPSTECSSNRTPAPEADPASPSNDKLRPQSPLQPPPAEQAQIATPHHARARPHEQDAVNFSLRMQYRGEERTTEIPLTPDMMRQLSIEAWLRDMRIGEVVSELIVAVFKRDLHSVLDRTGS